MGRVTQQFLRDVQLEGIPIGREPKGGRRNGAEFVANPKETAGGDDDRHNSTGWKIHQEVLHLAQFLILEVGHGRAQDLAGPLDLAETGCWDEGLVPTRSVGLVPDGVGWAG